VRGDAGAATIGAGIVAVIDEPDPPYDGDGSRGVTVRVAFGVTVLLKRSPLAFSTGARGAGAGSTTGSSFGLRLKMLSNENPMP
jgi:hypothetical protein